MSILIIKFCYKNSIDQLKITLLNVLSDVRMCEKYKIYYPYSIGPIVYTVMPELRGDQGFAWSWYLSQTCNLQAEFNCLDWEDKM